MENPIPFRFGPELSNLNLFFELPKDKMAIALQIMEKEARLTLPTESEQYLAKVAGSHAKKAFDQKYSEVADKFAAAIDPNFENWEERKYNDSNSKKTETLRAVFFNMIHPYNTEQILKGVDEIKSLGLVK